MCRLLAFLLVAPLLLSVYGCRTQNTAVETTDPSSTTAGASGVNNAMKPGIGSVYIFVDGKQKAVAPATVNVRRGFGETTVSLRRAGKEVRRYEVERVRTGESSSSDFSFGNDGAERGSERTIDSSELGNESDKNLLIPYHPETLTVEDREYRVTIVVRR